ncbi:hypothetical protein F4680DRAFT_449268 [Xylaria scruposa]|nr:hypothetical protein F4680DRAFT_449268 [Xylaria scruposa]
MDEEVVIFDGFCFGAEELDPVAQHLLQRRIGDMPLHIKEKSRLMYHNAMVLMIAAYSVKDLLKGRKNPNIPYFAAVARQFGATDTNAMRYLFKRFISGREMFYANNIPGRAARPYTDQVARLAKDVAKTMVQLDLLRDFTDVTTLLDTETIRNARLVKKIARAMIDKDLLKVVPDLTTIIDKRTTHVIRNRLSHILDNVNQMSRPRADRAIILEEAIADVECWDANDGADTYYNHLEYNDPLTGQAEAVGLHEDVLHD